MQYKEIEYSKVPGDVVGDLHEHPLVLAGGHRVGEHPDELVQPVRLLREELGGREEVLGRLYLALAAGEMLHGRSHAQHVPRPLQDVVVVADVLVDLKEVPGSGHAGAGGVGAGVTSWNGGKLGFIIRQICSATGCTQFVHFLYTSSDTSS